MDDGANGPVTVLLPFVMVPLRPLSFPNRLSSTWDVCATERYIVGCVWSTRYVLLRYLFDTRDASFGLQIETVAAL